MKLNIIKLPILFATLFAIAMLAQPIIAHSAERNEDGYRFVCNRGQWNDSILYTFSSKLGRGFITENGIHLSLCKSSPERNRIDGSHILISFPYRLHPSIEKQSECTINYFYDQLAITDVPAASVIYSEDTVTGIGIRLYFDSGYPRWDWSVPANIALAPLQFAIYGVTDGGIACTGADIHAETNAGTLSLGGIKAFYEADSVPLPYRLTAIAPNHFSISLNSTPTSKLTCNKSNERIIIDPLIYGAFLGGSDYDIAHSVACDTLGFAYLTGQTQSLNFPTTLGAYSDSLRHGDAIESDIFVTKVDSAGRKILFSTYIGSKASDIGKAIAIATDGSIVVTGYTAESFSFPTTAGAYQTKHAGAWDGFLLRLSKDGKRLLWSTLYGGTKDDFSQCLALADSTIYISGYSLIGSDLPTKSAFISFDTLGKNDCWVARFSQDGKHLLSSVLFGGAEDDFAQSIAVGADGRIYTCGFTSSAGFPTTAGAIRRVFADTVPPAVASDAFITVFASDGVTIDYSTLYGGSCRDGAYSIALSGEKVFVGGTTLSPDFPVTPFAFDTAYNRGKGEIYEGDCWVAEFIPNSQPIFSTYIGGSSADKIYSIALDKNENIYAVGATASKDFPVTRNAIDKSLDDKSNTSDAFMFKLTPDGKTLKYSTYLGGRYEDVANSIALPGDRSAFVVGSTDSPDFPHTAFAFDTTLNDSSKSDAFVLRLLTEQFEIYAGGRVAICRGDTAILGNPAIGGIDPITYKWSPDYKIVYSANGYCRAMPDTSMYYRVDATDASGRTCSDSVFVSVSERYPKWIFGPRYVYPGVTVTYRAIGEGNPHYRWIPVGGSVVSGADSTYVRIKWGSSGIGSLYLETTSDDGCVFRTPAKTINVGNLFRPVIYPPWVEPFCMGGNVVLDAGPDYWNVEWSDGRKGRFDTISVYGNYWAKMIYGTDTVLYSDTIHIEIGDIPAKPTFAILPDSLYCLEQANAYQWYFRNAAIPGGTARAHKPKYIGFYRVEVINSIGCRNTSDSLYVPVLPSVSEQQNPHFEISPNPASQRLLIRGDAAGTISYVITVYNCLGQVVAQTQTGGEITFCTELNIGTLPDGVYLVRLGNAYATETKCFVKCSE